MAGDPANASVWSDADVYVGATTAVDPADIDTAFGVDWDLVGLLDGDDGFTQQRSEDKTDHQAWGGILVRVSRRNYKMEHTFTVLEDNAVTRDLIWPGSTESKLYVPRPQRIKIAFETREGEKKRRLISAYEAEVEVDGDINSNETSLESVPLRATIFPDTSDVNEFGGALLFNRQFTDAES